MKKYLKTKRGFTLMELLVVVSIIGMLATIVLSSLSTARSRSRDAVRLSDVKQIQNALEMYYLDKGHYPPANSSTWPRSSSTCLNNGRSDWLNILTPQLAPYMNIPDTSAGSNDLGIAGLGLCYTYLINGGTIEDGCDPGSYSFPQGYRLVFGTENKTKDTQGTTLVGASGYLSNYVSPHYTNYTCAP
jgi:prepilin-type N-terminal cleavage/methylation domain-containing protein